MTNDNYNFGYDPFNESLQDFTDTTALVNGLYIPPPSECMNCGICVKHCPTYKIKAEENYGPRGRIRLMERALTSNEVLNDDEISALQSCTLCRKCESVCPSKTAYAELYRQSLQKIEHSLADIFSIKIILNMLSTRHWLQKLTSSLLLAYKKTGLKWLFERLPSSLLARDFQIINRLIPDKHAYRNIPGYSRSVSRDIKSSVALFTGCLANIFDTQTHTATIKLLNHLGYDVFVPKAQNCCGAIHAHHGRIDKAITLAKENTKAFSDERFETIIHNSSGCGAFLQEYPLLTTQDEQKHELSFTTSLSDISDFLVSLNWPESVYFTGADITVMVHEPCSQRKSLDNEDAVYQLLKKIPGLTLVSLPDNETCCGAGGTTMLTHPEIAEPLRDQKLKACEEMDVDIVVTTNMTCAMHLNAGISDSGDTIEIIHPVTLLERYLMTDES